MKHTLFNLIIPLTLGVRAMANPHNVGIMDIQVNFVPFDTWDVSTEDVEPFTLDEVDLHLYGTASKSVQVICWD